MLDELSTLLDSLPLEAGRADYLGAIIERNALGKQTTATRKFTAQRLTELYALESSVPLFRVLGRFWRDDVPGRSLLALLCSLARDPLLRATAEPILAMTSGEGLSRQKITDAIRAAVGVWLNEATLRHGDTRQGGAQVPAVGPPSRAFDGECADAPEVAMERRGGSNVGNMWGAHD
jgi:hypothetical protein